MDKFLRIVGIIVVAWIVLGLVGAIFGFLVKAVLWVALIAGVVLLIAAVANKANGRGRVRTGR